MIYINVHVCYVFLTIILNDSLNNYSVGKGCHFNFITYSLKVRPGIMPGAFSLVNNIIPSVKLYKIKISD